MKILHIIDSMDRGGLYGAEVVILNLVDEQIKIGLDPSIASIGEKKMGEKPLETEALIRGFKVKKFRMFPGPNIHGMLKVLFYARQNGFDILHSHGYKGDVAFGLIPKKLRKLPLISTLHGWTSVNGLSKNAIYEWLQRKSLGHMDAVVLVHKGMLSNPSLAKLTGVNFHVVNNGIPISDNTSPQRTQQAQITQAEQLTQETQSTQVTQRTQKLDQNIIDFCQSGWTIGSIGRLSTEKGYRYLIEALALLIKENIDARLVIIGEGYERNLLEELAFKSNLKDRILFPGYRDNAKYYLPYFNVFVMSSLTEGLPITLLEAMQAKVPIVATKVGGIPEVLQNGKGGLLVEPDNPNDIAKAVSSIYNNPNIAGDLASVSYQEAVTHYSSKAMASGYLDVYKELMQRDKPDLIKNYN